MNTCSMEIIHIPISLLLYSGRGRLAAVEVHRQSRDNSLDECEGRAILPSCNGRGSLRVQARQYDT